MNKKGMLISFEGGEGGGKTTQVALLAEEFKKKGEEVVLVREPGGTVISEKIRDVVLSTKNIGIVFESEVMLFQAARAQVYRELVLPSLKQGKIVICDRTRDSSVVYQGMIREVGVEFIESLNNFSTKNTFPLVTLLLDVPVEIGLERRRQTGEMNRLDMENKDFHEKVRQGYLKLAKVNDHRRWVIIDASKSMEEVKDRIWEEVKKRIVF